MRETHETIPASLKEICPALSEIHMLTDGWTKSDHYRPSSLPASGPKKDCPLWDNFERDNFGGMIFESLNSDIFRAACVNRKLLHQLS